MIFMGLNRSVIGGVAVLAKLSSFLLNTDTLVFIEDLSPKASQNTVGLHLIKILALIRAFPKVEITEWFGLEGTSKTI